MFAQLVLTLCQRLRGRLSKSILQLIVSEEKNTILKNKLLLSEVIKEMMTPNSLADTEKRVSVKQMGVIFFI